MNQLTPIQFLIEVTKIQVAISSLMRQVSAERFAVINSLCDAHIALARSAMFVED